jgi:CcmD family protein
MSAMESVLSVSIVFWSAIFVYIVWIDRKISSLKKMVESLQNKD